jgi:TolB-like protein
MRRGLSAVGLVFFILIPLCGFAGERPIVAVFDMEDSSATLQPEVLENLTEYLAVKLAEGGFQVIPRDQVKQRLVAEKKGTYRECFDKSCQIEMGRELAAQKVLSVKILKVAGRCQLTATLFDLKKAATEDAASAEGSCDEESMGQAVLKIAEKLSAKVAPEIPDQPAPEPPPEPAKIEVSEEATSPYSTWGHVTFWTGLGAAAFGTVTGILAYNAGEDFKSGDRDSYDRSVILAGCMYTGLAAGGALIITGIVLWALDPGDNVTSVSALPSADGGLVLTLGGRF